jgi:uncharacterized SAM-binding protein YcdF (DUF218 family)
MVSGKIMGWAEGAGSRRDVELVEPAEAVVVLSGMLQDRKDAPLGEWSDAVDRFEGGVELFQAGKAPLLIFTGGHVPWRPEDRPEGEILKERAVQLGVPGKRIQVTGKVGNTENEASAVKVLIESLQWREVEGGRRENKQPTANGQKHTKAEDGGRMSEDRRQRAVGGKPRIILVTSAFHMRRARMLFERQGFEVEPFPVDFQTSDRSTTTVLSFLPSAQALAKSETGMRESVGMLYYSIIKR